MRRRLIAVFFVPLIVILLVLGGAYAWTAAGGIRATFHAQQLGDLASFVTSARQSLRAGTPDVIVAEATRYEQLFGTHVAVYDRTGALWSHGEGQRPPSAEETAASLSLALSGRRSDLPEPVLPWAFGDTVLMEPVFDDGDVIGVVRLEASAAHAHAEIRTQWLVLAVVAVLAILLGLFIVSRLAGWVLRPMQRLDRAMVAIERGDMDARIDDDTGPPELRRMIGMFNSMADEIERALTRQREFAQNASHELRNPLGALLVRVESLATGLDESWDDDVEAAREEGRRMARILDTLLSLARSGRGAGDAEFTDLTDLAHRRALAWLEVAAAREIAIVTSRGAEAFCLVDPLLVEGALDAVLDNAVKFSPPGSRIDVLTESDDASCAIVVADRGPGLSEEEIAHATERFWRSGSSQNTPGSGLGLAIAADLLRTVHGTVTVTARDGGGLRVTLRVPAVVT